MAYAKPTASAFKERFPEFGTVADALVSAVIDEADPRTNDTWVDADRRPAVLYLTAHLLTIQGYPAASAADAVTTATRGPMKSRRVGDVSVEFAGVSGGSSGGASGSDYTRTRYGAEFLRIARRNFPAVAVV